jgi:hypothetical protein
VEWYYYLIAVPAGLLYLGLLALALREWAMRPGSRGLNRWLWLFIIVVFSIVGPAAYLALGRPAKPLDGSVEAVPR